MRNHSTINQRSTWAMQQERLHHALCRVFASGCHNHMRFGDISRPICTYTPSQHLPSSFRSYLRDCLAFLCECSCQSLLLFRPVTGFRQEALHKVGNHRYNRKAISLSIGLRCGHRISCWRSRRFLSFDATKTCCIPDWGRSYVRGLSSNSLQHH